MCVPEDMPKDTVHQILRGGYEKVYEAGALITGGHSIFDDEPKYGLSVTGFVHPDRILTNSGAKEGDVLLLTKPIGIGILTSAMKADLCSKESVELSMRLMSTLNKNGRDAMVKYRVHACTDVTGFALMGHLLEMAQGSDLRAEVEVSAVDLIPEALEFARMGVLPAGMYRNRTFAEQWVDCLLYTSGLPVSGRGSGAVRRAVAGECGVHHERYPRVEYRHPVAGGSRQPGGDLRL